MSVDTFPELTPPVLIIGTQCPGLGPKDVEKTISWRLEKYVSATPGVDHVESVSRNGFSIIYVWMKWGTDLNAAQTLVQQNATFAMAAVPKSLGVLPPFVLQYDPSNAPVVQVVVSGGGMSGPQLYDYAFNYIEPVLEGIPGVASARRRRRAHAADQRHRRPGQGAGAAPHVGGRLEGGGAPRTRSCRRASSSRTHFDANVYTNAVPPAVKTIGEAIIKRNGNKAVLIRDVARVEDGGTPETQAVSVNGEDAVALNVLRIPGGNTIDIVDAVKKAVATSAQSAAGRESGGALRSVDLRAHGLSRAAQRGRAGAVLDRHRHLDLPAERCAARSSSPSPSRCRSPSRSSCSTPTARR